MKEVKNVNNERLFADLAAFLSDGGTIRMRVKGRSMRPFLGDEKDVVEIAPLPIADLRRGMIVLFSLNGRYILHRLRRLEGNTLTLKGDGNYRITETVAAGSIAGYVKSIERNSGKIVPYASLRWKIQSAYSLSLKIMRVPWREAKRIIKKLL